MLETILMMDCIPMASGKFYFQIFIASCIKLLLIFSIKFLD